MMDFIESKFLDEQIESIKTLANYVNTLNRVGDGLGEYQFDKMTLGK
jgi:ferritin heavy chain